MTKSYPHGRCKAKSKQTGERCKNPVAPGYEVCRFHGGRTPRGPALPQFKHGRRSKYMPARLLTAYERALNDPQLFDLADSVALIDARIDDLLASSGGSAVFKDMRDTFDRLYAALQQQDPAGTSLALRTLDDLIRSGADHAHIWDDLLRLLDDRRKHVETQRRLELAGERGVSATEVVTLIGAIVNIAQEAITNIEDRRKFVAGIQSLTGRRTQPLQ